MEARRLTTPQKVIVWAILIFAVWRILQIPSVIEAILTFALAGEIPGTNVVLAPETIIRGAGFLLLFIGTILAAKPIIAARARRIKTPKAPSTRHIYTSNRQGEVLKVPAAPAYHPPRMTENLPEAVRSVIDWVQYRFVVDWYVIKSDVRKLIFWTSDGLYALWKWAEPHLWRFDAWLGEQYHLLRKELQRKMRLD